MLQGRMGKYCEQNLPHPVHAEVRTKVISKKYPVVLDHHHNHHIDDKHQFQTDSHFVNVSDRVQCFNVSDLFQCFNFSDQVQCFNFSDRVLISPMFQIGFTGNSHLLLRPLFRSVATMILQF